VGDRREQERQKGSGAAKPRRRTGSASEAGRPAVRAGPTPEIAPLFSGGPRPRHDGFTAERKKRFLETYAQSGCVRDGCRAAGISDTTFYRHYDKWPDFRSLCEAARSKASAHVELYAWERGVTGIEEPIIHYGKQVGVRRKRSDAIFKLILQASNPEKYGRIGTGGETKTQIEKRLRVEIEAEVRAEIAAAEPSIEQVRDEVLRRLEAIRTGRERDERGGR
jgi:hypothetical protein